MLRILSIAFVGMTFSVAVLAQGDGRYECIMGDLTRRVEIFYEPGGVLPCEVRYIKETEAPGQTQVLWNAQNEAGYCEARAREFVERLRTLGWQCAEPRAAASTNRESAAEDDTAVLSAPQ
jgi:hypothetical protein